MQKGDLRGARGLGEHLYNGTSATTQITRIVEGAFGTFDQRHESANYGRESPDRPNTKKPILNDQDGPASDSGKQKGMKAGRSRKRSAGKRV